MGSLNGDTARILGQFFPKTLWSWDWAHIFMVPQSQFGNECLIFHSGFRRSNPCFHPPSWGFGHLNHHQPWWNLLTLQKETKIKWTPSGWVGVYLNKPVLWKFTSGKKKSHSEKIYTCPTTQLQFMAKMYLIWLSLWSFSSIKPFKINYTTSTATLPWRDGLTHPSSAWNLRSYLWMIIPWFSNCL